MRRSSRPVRGYRRRSQSRGPVTLSAPPWCRRRSFTHRERPRLLRGRIRAMIPERYASVTYALFRIVFGYVFLLYGLQKTAGWFGGQQVALMSWPQGPAGIVETLGGLLIMLGLFTRDAAFIASGAL